MEVIRCLKNLLIVNETNFEFMEVISNQQKNF